MDISQHALSEDYKLYTAVGVGEHARGRWKLPCVSVLQAKYRTWENIEPYHYQVIAPVSFLT